MNQETLRAEVHTQPGGADAPGHHCNQEVTPMGWEYHNRRRDYHGYFRRQGKSADLHIRVTEKQHATIRARATAQFKDISEYILHLVQEDLLTANGEKMCTQRGKPPQEREAKMNDVEIKESLCDDIELALCPLCDGNAHLIFKNGPGKRCAYMCECLKCLHQGPEAVFYEFNDQCELVAVNPNAPTMAAALWNCHSA